tara:strand:+ start:103 stop:546 length:444 start_codon:yes stop_codon:yes gene_type:complete
MYKVGQIIYALLENKKVIIPIKIIEEITVKNLQEETTTYKVKIPNNKKDKVDLSKFDKVFVTIDEAADYMIENAKKAIDDLTYKALELEEKFFKEDLIKNEACINDINKVKIDLGDGVKANIDIDILNTISNQKGSEINASEESSTA